MSHAAHTEVEPIPACVFPSRQHTLSVPQQRLFLSTAAALRSARASELEMVSLGTQFAVRRAAAHATATSTPTGAARLAHEPRSE
jgi:hypothetical protein